MALTKLSNLGPEYSADYENAQHFDCLRAGEKGIYFRSGLWMCCIPYPQLSQIFRRVIGANAHVCCGGTNFEYHAIVPVSEGKEYELKSEKEDAMIAALEYIAQKSPSTKIGK